MASQISRDSISRFLEGDGKGLVNHYEPYFLETKGAMLEVNT
jgi:hypothetical protein